MLLFCKVDFAISAADERHHTTAVLNRFQSVAKQLIPLVLSQLDFSLKGLQMRVAPSAELSNDIGVPKFE